VEFLVTHSEKNSIQGISCNQFQGISCFPILQKIQRKICGNSWVFLAKRSSEPIPGNFLGTIHKIFSRVPQEYLEIFTNKSSE